MDTERPALLVWGIKKGRGTAFDRVELISFILVVAIGGEDKYHDLRFEDARDHSVLLGDFTAPTPFGFPLQGLGMSGSHERMFFQLFDKA